MAMFFNRNMAILFFKKHILTTTILMKNLLFLLLGAFLLLTSCAPKQLIRLNAYAIPAGKPMVFRMTTTSETTVQMPESEEKTTYETVEQDITYLLKKNNEDGTSLWESQILRYKSIKNAGGGKIEELDSEHFPVDTDDIKITIFKKLIATPFTFTLAPDGTISNLSGMNDIWKATEATLPKEERATFAGVVGQFGDDFLLEMTQKTWAFYPPGKVRKGKHWKKEKLVKMFNAVETTRYEFAGQANGFNQIKASSVTEGDAKHPGELKIGPAKILYYMNGTGASDIQIDMNTGFIDAISGSTDLSGTMDVKVPFLASNKLPIHIKSKVVMSRID